MRIVVTGATGNIGSAVVEELRRDSRVTSVVGVARRRPAPRGWPADVELREADVVADDLAPAFAGADVVVHLAWLFQPTHDPLVTWQANVIGSIRMAEAAVAAGVGAIVHSSSVGVYSPGEGPVAESWPTHSRPTAAYGREKAYVERVLDAVEARHQGLRPAFVFQRPAASEQRRLFMGPLVPRALLRPGRLPAVPMPAGLRFQAVHARDVARAFAAAALGDARGAFNVAADPVIDIPTLREVLGTRVVEVPRPLFRNALAAVDALVGLENVVKIVKVTGFVAAAEGFTAVPGVINGASDLFGAVFGEAGRHARSAVGVAELPLDAPVEVEVIVEVA